MWNRFYKRVASLAGDPNTIVYTHTLAGACVRYITTTKLWTQVWGHALACHARRVCEEAHIAARAAVVRVSVQGYSNLYVAHSVDC